MVSDTAPVRDAIQDGWNGRMVPFFDGRALADAVLDGLGLESPSRTAALRRQAQADAGRYSCLSGLLRYEHVLRAPSAPCHEAASQAMDTEVTSC